MTEQGSGGQDAIDRTVLDELSEVRPSLVEEMIRHFLREAPDRLDLLRAGAEGADGERLRRAAHGLRSSAGMVGARELAGLCERIEVSVSRGQVDEAVALARQVDGAFERVRAALEAMLARPDPTG